MINLQFSKFATLTLASVILNLSSPAALMAQQPNGNLILSSFPEAGLKQQPPGTVPVYPLPMRLPDRLACEKFKV